MVPGTAAGCRGATSDSCAKRLELPSDTLELLARYQTTLDNQLFKLLKALREAQEWRLKTIDPVYQSSHDDVELVDQAA